MSNPWPPPSRPREVDGGIKARSKRGAIGETWWSERFIEVLESIGVGARLQRGRAYARMGQVLDLNLDAGSVTALVQGSRARPYRVRIGLVTFDKTGWTRAEQALARDAWYAARLLAGEMPEDIEDAFAAVGLSLFPAGPHELSMDCTCPDWELPCKHLAAVCYLLAESFDGDPFAILAWRGRDRDDLLTNLAALRAGRPAADHAETATAPLADCLTTFFRPQAELPQLDPPRTSTDSLLAQLPAPDLTIRGANIVDLLRPAYRALGGAAGPDAADEGCPPG